MELHCPAPVLDSEKHKGSAMKNRIKPHRKKEQGNNATSSSTGIRCSECSMSFLSTKALFGHLRIHRKGNRGVQKSSLLQLRQAKLSNEFIAACILMGIRRSKLQTDIDDAKLSKLRWVCSKIERKRKRKNIKEVKASKKICHKVAPSLLALAGQSAGQWSRNSSDEEMNAGAAGSAEVEIHQCDKCDKVFNSGQALGGHKRAHYTGPPISRPGSNGRPNAAAAVAEVVARDFDLNEPVEEVIF